MGNSSSVSEKRVMRGIREENAAKVLKIACIILENLTELVKIDMEMRVRSEEGGGSSDDAEQNQHLSFISGYETLDDAQIMIADVAESAKELLRVRGKGENFALSKV